jgi:hypothetical protein
MEACKTSVIERECARLVLRYAALIDSEDPTPAADLFSLDGEWASASSRIAGREAIREFLGNRPQMVKQHFFTNTLIEATTDTTATGFTAVLLFSAESPLPTGNHAYSVVVGHYRDNFISTTNGWRFSRRFLTVVMSAR